MSLVDVDNDILIQEVKARPCLYKKEHPRYIDTAFKKSLWEDVAEKVFHRNWANYTSEERVTQVKALFMRWKNLRTCFTRELRTQMRLKERYGTTKHPYRHAYRYFNELQFLKPHVEVQNYTFDAFADEPVEQDNSPNEVQQQTSPPVPQIKTYTRIKRQVQQYPNSEEHVLSKNVMNNEPAASNASSNQEAEQLSLKSQTKVIVQQSKHFKNDDLSVTVTLEPPIEIDNSSDEDAQPIIKLYTKPTRKFPEPNNYKKRKVSENLQACDVHGSSIFVNFHELPTSSTVKVESMSPSRVISTEFLDTVNSSNKKEPAKIIIKYESPSPVEFEATEPTIHSETSIAARDHSFVTNLNRDQSVVTDQSVDSVGPEENSPAKSIKSEKSISVIDDPIIATQAATDTETLYPVRDHPFKASDTTIISQTETSVRDTFLEASEPTVHAQIATEDKSEPSEIDWKTFALSLVPMLKMLPVHKSLDAQIEILTTVKRYLNSDSSVSNISSRNISIQHGGPSCQNFDTGKTDAITKIKIEGSCDGDEEIIL